MKIIEESTALALKKNFGFNEFKGQQEEIILNLLKGKDTFVLMPTGGGKSLCYQLPAFMCEGTALVVSPLIALMKNQVDAVRGLSKSDTIAHYLNSTLSKSEANKVKDDVLSGKTKLLYVAPESLTRERNIDFFKKINISFVAIDEAHCISEWGHDFRPEYRKLRTIIENINNVNIIALTATATPKVQLDIQKNLGMQDATVFKASFNRDNLIYEVRPKFDVEKEIIKYVKQNEGKSGIIYCLSRKKVNEIAELLKVNGINALPYHAGLDTQTRAKHQDMFLMEDVNVIVATIAFGMGIDKPDVRFVIHHDIPKSIEGYYQETGRAGRDGGEGKCIAFYAYKDIEKLEKFLIGKPISEQEVGKQLLHEMVSYSESAVCRRKMLLNYFGEVYDEKKCDQGCDNCVHPKEKFEGKEYVSHILKIITELKQKFKAKYIINFITGINSAEIREYKHSEHPLYNNNLGKDNKFWSAILRQSIVHDLLEKEIESYGILKISKKGKLFLENPKSLMLTQNHDYDTIPANFYKTQDKVSAADPILVNILKDLRKSVAQQKGVPPFVVFQDPSIEDMAINFPCNLDELKNIVGVGTGKALKFGSQFINKISKYVEDNNIERPTDLVVKSMVNKSGLKVYIIQNIDRKIPLEDIAESKGKSIDFIIEEIEGIVLSGTRINIDYYIDEMLEEDQQEEVYEYFKEAKTDSISNALDDFEDEYTEEELRLMRVKFLSEFGN